MKPLLLTLILSSLTASAFAGWDDVYDCEEILNQVTWPNAEIQNWTLSKFTFKSDKARNAIVFPEYDGYFSGKVHEIDEAIFNKDSEKITSAYIYFSNERFIYSRVWSGAAYTKVATCDKILNF